LEFLVIFPVFFYATRTANMGQKWTTDEHNQLVRLKTDHPDMKYQQISEILGRKGEAVKTRWRLHMKKEAESRLNDRYKNKVSSIRNLLTT
jgi:aspartyl/asparaginyl-tRNA synthetase